MQNQNFKNHTRLVPTYHGLTFLGILILIIGSIVNLFQSDNVLSSVLMAIISFVLLSLALHNRSFALKAQDRAIRAEENFRHFLLSGKPLNKNLRIGQIIALRFASDEEMVELAEQASKENLNPKSIKLSVKNWRPDYHRA